MTDHNSLKELAKCGQTDESNIWRRHILKIIVKVLKEKF